MIISKNDRDGSFRPGQAYRKERAMLESPPSSSPELLNAILVVFPLDIYTESAARHDPRGAEVVGFHARFRFYDEARTCYCALQSGETSIYANIILKKGVVKQYA